MKVQVYHTLFPELSHIQKIQVNCSLLQLSRRRIHNHVHVPVIAELVEPCERLGAIILHGLLPPCKNILKGRVRGVRRRGACAFRLKPRICHHIPIENGGQIIKKWSPHLRFRTAVTTQYKLFEQLFKGLVDFFAIDATTGRRACLNTGT